MVGKFSFLNFLLTLSIKVFLTFFSDKQLHNFLQTEVNYLGQLHHPNLVKLIGYCSDGDNRLLVYEFLPKGSLENHLFRSKFNKFTNCCLFDLSLDSSLCEYI